MARHVHATVRCLVGGIHEEDVTILCEPWESDDAVCEQALTILGITDRTRLSIRVMRREARMESKYQCVNLDDAPHAELVLMRRTPHVLHPAQRAYAGHILLARQARLAGAVHTALVRECKAERAYERLPEYLRW